MRPIEGIMATAGGSRPSSRFALIPLGGARRYRAARLGRGRRFAPGGGFCLEAVQGQVCPERACSSVWPRPAASRGKRACGAGLPAPLDPAAQGRALHRRVA